MDKQTGASTQGRHTGRARGQQARTNRSGMGATPSMARATPKTLCCLPSETRGTDRGKATPRRTAWADGAQAAPPPPTPPPGAGTPQTRRPTPRGAHNPKPGRGGAGPGHPPLKQAKWSTGPRQDTQRGTDRVEWPYQRPAPGLRGVRAPHQPGKGGAGRGRRESASAHTHKGHAGNTRRATGPSLRNAQTALNGVPASEDEGHPDGKALPHTARETRGGKGETGKTRHPARPPQPRAGRKRRAHTTRALHPPRQ